MSLVGTRPPTVDEWEQYELHHRSRMSTKPGITGMWQVSGRSDITDFEEVVRLDTEYIENSSVTGQISDVTARFYEAMACKTLIIGFKPDTFDCLFPEDAMVTLKKDGSDFFSIIDFYESHPEEYNRIVNRNYELLMESKRKILLRYS